MYFQLQIVKSVNQSVLISPDVKSETSSLSREGQLTSLRSGGSVDLPVKHVVVTVCFWFRVQLIYQGIWCWDPCSSLSFSSFLPPSPLSLSGVLTPSSPLSPLPPPSPPPPPFVTSQPKPTGKQFSHIVCSSFGEQKWNNRQSVEAHWSGAGCEYQWQTDKYTAAQLQLTHTHSHTFTH